ncbi:GDP-L-fucose synthase [Amylibacter sp.]|nr:GDP-L-fucose synthase [Amylibacter sp.]
MAKQNIYVAGHNGMVGSALVRQLKNDPKNNILTASRADLDLTNQLAVHNFFKRNSIDQVYLAAAKVGGIHANNTYRADFIYENLMVQTNVVNSAHEYSVQKLLFLGSSCIYPKLTEQPIKENALLTGTLEPTNEPYAIAKIAGIKLCESYNHQYGRDYRSVMPTNLYGPGDNYHPENSHVIPALIRRFHEAKINILPTVMAWGTGKPRREFLYVDDMAEAAIFVQNLPSENFLNYKDHENQHLNIGCGEDCSIKHLTELVAEAVGYQGEIIWDKSRPDGTPRKLLDVSALKNLGWTYRMSLSQGLKLAYEDFLQLGVREK